jgi:hypothetical protein
MGYNAMSTSSAGPIRNVAIGYGSMQAITNAGYNTGVGMYSLNGVTTGANNTAMGYEALANNTTGAGNVALGKEALKISTTAGANIGIGFASGQNITTGSDNIFIGLLAGAHNIGTSTGYQNVVIGNYADTGTVSTINANVIGYNVTGDTGYTTLGNQSSDIRAANGNTTWSTVSDKRVKKDITDAEAGLSFINDLRPRTFKYKAKGDLPEEFDAYEEGSTEAYKNEFINHGFIAQEVKEAVDNHPELKDGFKMWDVRETGQQEVGEAAVIPVLVKAVQELSTMVDELKAEITTLKGE